uniref:ArnT family glycosyltransferase n=1 Tax=uncultured Sphingomonas sp. TaxID=158754 RepID=UPI0035CB73ED
MTLVQRLRVGGPLLVLLLLALALRAPDFGNPVIHTDEQYYLLVGSRMWHGALPYINLWDRKPIGLFLLYAATRLLPGDGIVAYQIVALVFAVLTAWAIGRAARQAGANPAGALIAGAAYLEWLPLLSGRAGQAPVFFNLFIALGAVLTLRLPGLARRGDLRAIVWGGAGACLLAGLAIQTKYTPAVEGALFGLAHLFYLRRAGGTPRVLGAAAVLWLLLGLAPTLAALAFYWQLGRPAFEAFWYDNFASIFARGAYSYPLELTLRRLAGIGAQLLLLAICAGVAVRRDWAREEVRMAAAWMGAALVPFILLGVYFDHYALPLLPPLLTLAAPTFARHRRIALGIVAAGLTVFTIEAAIRPDDAPGVRALAAVVKVNSGGECPYVFIGDAIVYHLADACIPTAYVFPSTLAYAPEQGATGIDEAAEVRRILAHRPPVIVSASRPLAEWNRQSLAMVSAALARNYRPVFSTPRGDYRAIVYLRRDRAFIG